MILYLLQSAIHLTLDHGDARSTSRKIACIASRSGFGQLWRIQMRLREAGTRPSFDWTDHRALSAFAGAE
ncbi:hypothetical protein DV706_04040 [Natronorubrum bangense]|uniref:Uncharacterized protein n=1 Tax=Natronorubrum bangense TaxID=61858 RepID=A0A4D6HLW7_9EURY|nr:hypothetical protein DV706_04040 [Natronorubrum bangense]